MSKGGAPTTPTLHDSLSKHPMLALACCVLMAQVPVVPASPKDPARLQLVPMARAPGGPLPPHHALSPGVFSVRLWDSPDLVTLP